MDAGFTHFHKISLQFIYQTNSLQFLLIQLHRS